MENEMRRIIHTSRKGDGANFDRMVLKTRTDLSDRGMHTVCAVMTEQFLRYSKAQGNDLSTPQINFKDKNFILLVDDYRKLDLDFPLIESLAGWATVIEHAKEHDGENMINFKNTLSKGFW